jgi:hypothetical protein
LYDRVILLVRDPFDTLLSEFNRRKSGADHTGLASVDNFANKEWTHFVEKQCNEWKEFYKFYVDNYKPEQLYILRYVGSNHVDVCAVSNLVTGI